MSIKSLLKNLFLLLVVLLISAILIEIFLSFFYPQKLYNECYAIDHPDSNGSTTHFDPRFGWFTKPNYNNCFYDSETNEKIYFRHNSKGLRLDKEVDYKKSNKTRIVLLGDSFTYGGGLDQESTIAYKLQNKLGNGYEVLPFGVPGFGTDQSLILLKEEVLKYKPDIVILNYFQNDLANSLSREIKKPYIGLFENKGQDLRYTYLNYPVANHTEYPKINPLEEKKIIKWFLKNSYLFSLFYHNTFKIRNKLFPNKISYIEKYRTYEYITTKVSLGGGETAIGTQRQGHINEFFVFEREGTENFDARLYSVSISALYDFFFIFKTHSFEEDFKFLVVNIPSIEQVSKPAQKRYINQFSDVNADFFDFNKIRIDLNTKIIQPLNLEYIDLFESFNGRDDFYIKNDWHLSDEGNEVVANEIYKEVRELQA